MLSESSLANDWLRDEEDADGYICKPASFLLPFPYLDLSAQKLRPALILANAGRSD